ncbi:ABC transporter ATP-binding protein [Paenalkalicoccus suaedae]|uniref:ABC transporter ATP-binding protein n=1 Tax=Paenalkalicoccus suaedae TaxID=2592382 RepID=A0A859F9K6_9BACI|nr:ABC transporter ATP-binding protein [Paenalkalicoccus suaedae]
MDVLHNLSLRVTKGKITALLGPNGSGKTTLMKGMCGLLKLDSGEITVNNIPASSKKVLGEVGCILEGERNVYYYLTVYDNLYYFGKLNRLPRKRLIPMIDTVLEQLGLLHKKHTYVSELSRGMQQKVALAVLLIKDPPVFLLDEPTLGLDVRATLELCDYLKELSHEQGKTVLLTTHQLEIAEKIADEIIFFDKGEVILHENKETIFSHYQGENRWTIQTQTPVEASVRAEIQGWSAISEDGLQLEVANEHVFKVIAVLEQQGVQIISLENSKRNLQDIFLEITKVMT